MPRPAGAVCAAGRAGDRPQSTTLRGPTGQTNTNTNTNTHSIRADLLTPALLDAVQHLLAQQVGPIAKLLVKKAAAAQPQRDGFIHLLLASVDNPAARRRLQDALNRLP